MLSEECIRRRLAERMESAASEAPCQRVRHGRAKDAPNRSWRVRLSGKARAALRRSVRASPVLGWVLLAAARTALVPLQTVRIVDGKVRRLEWWADLLEARLRRPGH